MKRFVVLVAVVVFALTTSLAFSAGKMFVVIKDKKGVCKIIKADKKTPKTIAGPFAKKADAEKAKAKMCPPKAKKAKKSMKKTK